MKKQTWKTLFRGFRSGLWATILMFGGFFVLIIFSRGVWEVIKWVYSW